MNISLSLSHSLLHPRISLGLGSGGMLGMPQERHLGAEQRSAEVGKGRRFCTGQSGRRGRECAGKKLKGSMTQPATADNDKDVGNRRDASAISYGSSETRRRAVAMSFSLSCGGEIRPACAYREGHKLSAERRWISVLK